MFQLHTQMHAKRTIPQHLNVLRELGEKDTSSQITILLNYAWCAPQYVIKIFIMQLRYQIICLPDGKLTQLTDLAYILSS